MEPHGSCGSSNWRNVNQFQGSMHPVSSPFMDPLEILVLLEQKCPTLLSRSDFIEEKIGEKERETCLALSSPKPGSPSPYTKVKRMPSTHRNDFDKRETGKIPPMFGR